MNNHLLEIYEQIAKGAIIRSKTSWYEKGEKSNKYFFTKTVKRITKLKALSSKFSIEKEFLLQILKRFYRKLIIFIPIFANGIPSKRKSKNLFTE